VAGSEAPSVHQSWSQSAVFQANNHHSQTLHPEKDARIRYNGKLCSLRRSGIRPLSDPIKPVLAMSPGRSPV
jgi:hypothetical protein